jgi:hypothetical protein
LKKLGKARVNREIKRTRALRTRGVPPASGTGVRRPAFACVRREKNRWRKIGVKNRCQIRIVLRKQPPSALQVIRSTRQISS